MKKFFALTIAAFVSMLSLNLFAGECTGLSLEWSNFAQYNYVNRYRVDSADYEKSLIMTLNQSGSVLPGTYDLGSKGNSDLNCTECVLAYTDPDDDGYFTKTFFQKSGTLKVDEVDAKFNIKGTISVVLAEFEFGEEDDDTNVYFLDDGACLEIESASFDSGVCYPKCEEGWECGDDGCGGTCGAGCGELACGENHQCVERKCEELTLDTTEVEFDDYYGIYSMAYTPNTGNAEGEDMFQFQPFFQDISGTVGKAYNLAGTNYADEEGIFIFIREDTEDSNMKSYFQYKGTAKITAYDDDTYAIKAQLTGVSVEQVTIDTSTYETVPVAGGKCYDIKDVTFSYPAGNDTGSDPDDTGDTGSDPADTGDTGSNPDDTADTDDTEVPGDTTDTEVPGDTGSAPSDGTDATPSDDDAASDDDATPEKEDKDSSGCSVVTL